nr:putative reverse transcriptase, RNA-dependent DNA polymerase, Gag-polypeptide of LTR copia-type [Tanacetum cinerariifolium]
MLLMQAQENRVALDAEQLLFLAGGPDNAFDNDVDEQPIQDLALNVDNVFQAEDCDVFDSDVDEAPTAQTMFMANLSSADPITDEAEPSYDSDILSEVQDHDQYLDDNCAYQEEHVMHDSVQLDHVVDLHVDHTSISNMIPYDQYVKDNDVSVVHSNASSVLNDTFMMIYDAMCEPIAPSVSNSSRNAVVKNSVSLEKSNKNIRVIQKEYNEESVRRSSRKTSLPIRLKDYELQGKVKYGLNEYVNYANLSLDNYSFVTNLNKTIEPKTYKEASTDSKWVEAMNNEMEALNRNGMVVMYKASDGFELTAFIDSDLAKCNVTKRFVIGYVVFLSSCLVSWKSNT